MIDNDQSTIIEAPEVYKSIPTHCPLPTNRMYQKKNVDFETFVDMLWSILLNQTFRITYSH
jgi:hypothetical protein